VTKQFAAWVAIFIAGVHEGGRFGASGPAICSDNKSEDNHP